MGYATSDQIIAEFKDLTIGTSTNISTTDVTAFIADADAEINSRLSVKYITPITGTESLVVMKMVEVWLVKHRILEIIKVKSGVDKADQQGQKTYRQMALDLLADLAAGKSKLNDATLASAADGVRSYSSENAIANVFDRTIDQW